MTGKAKVSICSGQPVDDMSAQSRTLSLREYLTKPYIPGTLPRMIDRSFYDLVMNQRVLALTIQEWQLKVL